MQKNWLATLSLFPPSAVSHPPHLHIQLLKPCSLFSAEPEGIQLGVRRHEYESLWSTSSVLETPVPECDIQNTALLISIKNQKGTEFNQ